MSILEAVGRDECNIRDLARLNYTGNFMPALAILSPMHLVRLQEEQFPAAVIPIGMLATEGTAWGSLGSL